MVGLGFFSEDAGTQFTSTKFQEEFQTRGVGILLAAPEHQEINGQVKVTRRTFHTITHSLIIHVRVSEAYIHFASIYTSYHIFPLLPIKDLINKDGDPTTPFKLATGTKSSILYMRILFCPCFVRKDTAHVGSKTLIIRNQVQNVFRVILIIVKNNQKRYPVYVPQKRKIKSLYNASFGDIFIVLWRTHQNHIKKQCLCDRKCRTYNMIHHQRNKLTMNHVRTV